MAVNPTGASLATASVPRKSRSPSTTTRPLRMAISNDVATDDGARDAFSETSLRAKRHQRARWLGAVPLLQQLLRCPELTSLDRRGAYQVAFHRYSLPDRRERVVDRSTREPELNETGSPSV